MRWSLVLQGFNLIILHKKGAENLFVILEGKPVSPRFFLQGGGVTTQVVRAFILNIFAVFQMVPSVSYFQMQFAICWRGLALRNLLVD